MQKAKLIENYEYLLNDAVSPMAHSVITQTTASTLITNSSLLTEGLKTSVGAYDNFVNVLGFPSPADTAMANNLRNDVKTQLGRLAKQLNLDYPGKEAALKSSGLPLANPNTAPRPDGDGQFNPVITLSDGTTPGCLLVTFEGFGGSVQKISRYNPGLPLPPEHWPVAMGGGRSREIGPFPKGMDVQVMSAPLTGSTTDPIYSPVVSRIVQ